MPRVFAEMIDTIYESSIARDGRYWRQDGTAPFNVRVMKKEPDQLRESFGSRAIVPAMMLAVRCSQVDRPIEGDTISRIDADSGVEALFDVEAAVADDERIEWLLSVKERPGS